MCNFRESVDSREFFNIFIFCPDNHYSTLFSKITLKSVTAFYFFINRAKFEKRQSGALSSMKLAKIKHFLRARTEKRDLPLNEMKSQNKHKLVLLIQ